MAILEPFIAEPPPLQVHEGGVVRVGGTRVTLDTVIEAWQDGATAEQVVQSYDTLELADVHALLSYYLRHRAEVEEYLSRRQDAQTVKRENERRFPPDEFGARLLTRRQRGVVHAR